MASVTEMETKARVVVCYRSAKCRRTVSAPAHRRNGLLTSLVLLFTLLTFGRLCQGNLHLHFIISLVPEA